jgi:3-oxoacyl-[acyl-carrier protein] reductase
MSKELAGKVAIVTGASRGIGAAIAIELAHRGACVAIVYTSASSTAKAEAVADKIKAAGSRAIILRVDLADPNCGELVRAGTLEGLGVEKVDILVNNAGVAQSAMDILSLDIQPYLKEFDR